MKTTLFCILAAAAFQLGANNLVAGSHVVNLSPTKATYLTAKRVNHSQYPFLVIGEGNVGLLYFDLSSIPADAVIDAKHTKLTVFLAEDSPVSFRSGGSLLTPNFDWDENSTGPDFNNSFNQFVNGTITLKIKATDYSHRLVFKGQHLADLITAWITDDPDYAFENKGFLLGINSFKPRIEDVGDFENEGTVLVDSITGYAAPVLTVFWDDAD